MPGRTDRAASAWAPDFLEGNPGFLYNRLPDLHDSDLSGIGLRLGDNQILARVFQIRNRWGFCARPGVHAGSDELRINGGLVLRPRREHREAEAPVDGWPRGGTDVIAMARPEPLNGISDEPGANGVEVDVSDELQQMGIPRAEQRLKAALKEVPAALPPGIEAARIACEKIVHDPRYGKAPDLQEQMEVVGHQTITEEAETASLFDLGQDQQEPAPVIIVEINNLLIVPAGHDVKHGPGMIDSLGSSHNIEYEPRL